MDEFFQGQRVKPSQLGIKVLGSHEWPNKKYKFNEHLRGTVTSVSEHVHVRIDGKKVSSPYHKSFWQNADGEGR